MKSPIHEASARPHSGEPFSGLSANDARRDRLCNQDLAEVDGEIARLVDCSTPELQRAWRTLHHTGPLESQPELFLQGSREDAANGMTLPAGHARHLVDRGTLGLTQHRNHHVLIDPAAVPP